MSHTPDNLIMALVHACADMSEGERVKYLERECRGDPKLRRDVDAILAEPAKTTDIRDGRGDFQKVLPGHYRLKGILGSGGMGTVYLAEDSRLDRHVAIKFLNDSFRGDPDRLSRFNQEARSASALNHPNIITIHDIGESDGIKYIVSEYVEGETLGSRIARGRLSIDEALNISIQIASALRAAHSAGVIHRDLKPDNIMLRRDGTVKVVDFGLAKGSGSLIHSESQVRSLGPVMTLPGMILGTPRYMSPEQTRGIPLDERSDVFSLGLIIFEMLTGHSPFGGTSIVDIIAAVISKEPRRLDAYITDPPDGIERIIDRALEKVREYRYPTMDEMLVDLVELQRGLSGHSAEFRSAHRSGVNISGSDAAVGRSQSYWRWLAGAALFTLIVFAGWWFVVGRGPRGITKVPMRSVAITSWSSVSGESVAASAFSRDAKMVAFASTRSGTTEIWAKPTVGGDPIQVTRNGFYNQYPVWSPDDQELAFFSSRGETNGLWRVSFTGGREVQVVSGLSPTARTIRWSADHKIYFQDGIDLFTVDSASGDRKQLTDFATLGIRPATIAVSPDGGTIAISVKENSVWKVKVKMLGADVFTEMAASKDRIDGIRFYPDGKSLLYTGIVDGIEQIYSVISTSVPPVLISSGSTDATLQDVSSDGSKVLFSSLNESSDLWMADTRGSKQSVVANDVPEEYWADIAPDAKSVVYQSVPLPERPFRGSIFVKSLTPGGSPMLISQDGFLPVWSRDGQWIAFVRRLDTGFSIWKARPSGADATKLADGDIATPGYSNVPYLQIGVGHIAWTPDSSAVAYSAKTDGISNIWLAPVDGGLPRQLSANKDPNETYATIVWSADGKEIGFTSQSISGSERSKAYRLWITGARAQEAAIILESPNDFRFLGFAASGDAVIAEKADPTDLSPTPATTHVYLIDTRTGAKRKTSELSSAYFHNIHLSRDGESIAFVTRANNTSAILTVPTAGGTAKKVLLENDPKVLISSLAWSPDGRFVIFGNQTRTNVLSMLTN